MHPEKGWDKYFKTFRARRHLALIALMRGSHEWPSKNRPKNLTTLEKEIGKELRRRGGEWSFRGFLFKNYKVGFEEGDAVAIAGQPRRDGVYDGLEDSVGTMRVI